MLMNFSLIPTLIKSRQSGQIHFVVEFVRKENQLFIEKQIVLTVWTPYLVQVPPPHGYPESLQIVILQL